MRLPHATALLLLTACVQEVGPGPDLGDCADPPDGVYTYGQIGIGTCLSGPADLIFFEQQDTDWLAVSNANPFVNFDSGSVLLIDWASVDLEAPVNEVDDLEAHAVPMDSFVGGLDYIADEFKQVLLVAGRLSEDSRTRFVDDEAWVLDVSDPTDPQPWSLGDMIELRDDPQPVVADNEVSRAYVGNITDHSVSVIDTSGAPLQPIDVAPEVELGEPDFVDADGSGSTAEVALGVADGEEVPSDAWTLTWVDATHRVWVPEQDALRRYSTGGLDYVSSAWGLELDDDSGLIDVVDDPYYTSALGIPQMWFGDRGGIYGLYQEAAGSWNLSTLYTVVPPGTGWDAWATSPSGVTSGDSLLVYYDGRSEPGAAAAIGLAVASGGGAAVRHGDPVLEPSEPYTSFEDPFVRSDALARATRMWLSMYDGTRWTIGTTETTDGVAWEPPDEVLALEGQSVASPVLSYGNGRYRMWFALGDGTSWSIATAWSWDGRDWRGIEEVLEVEGAHDPLDPPRVALLSDSTAGFRIESEDRGVLSGLATPGGTFRTNGFTIRAATGHEIGTDVLGDASANGLLPVSSEVVDGRRLLYVTAIDASDRRGIAVLERDAFGWVALADDLIPAGTGGNEAGASDPVVVSTDDGLAMYYAAYVGDGSARLRRAVSDDGVSWDPAPLDVPEPADWESVARLPHSARVTGSGRLRLWYTGDDGARKRIGVLASGDLETFEAVPGPVEPWQVGVGDVGTFDASGVADPVVFDDGTTQHLWYAGFDGTTWALGHATRSGPGQPWVRDTDPATGATHSKLFPIANSFSSDGVRSPVILADDGSDPVDLEVLFGGSDGAAWRVGRALGSLDRLFPAHRFPTVLDRVHFTTERGDTEPGPGVIELAQTIDGVSVSGLGMSTLRLDEERGVLYVAAKRTISAANYIYVLDVRDDTIDGWTDRNYLDVEAILRVGQTVYSSGFRDVIPIPGTDLLYASGHLPDAVVIFDLSRLEDRADKYVIDDAAIGALPLRRVPSGSSVNRPPTDEDAGSETQATTSGSGMALTPEGETLLVTHFRENSVIAFDLTKGVWGEQIRRIQHVGENPHLVRIAPDGKHAVVANYLGEVDDAGITSSTLAVIDIDPASDTYLQVVTRIVNR